MATITLNNALPDYQWLPDYFEPSDLSRITRATATTLRWSNADGSTVEMKGSGFTYNSQGAALEGTIDSITVRDGGTTLMSITKINGALSEFFDWAFGFTRDDRDPENGDGFNFMTAILRGNDTINGSADGDDIIGGRNLGNDTVNGNNGDDFIKADAGRDTINGGSGYDYISGLESFFDPSASGGMVINVAAGTMTDCWGFTDNFTSIEAFEGSKFRDTFNAGTGDDYFAGLRGRDTINGGEGFDQADYSRDVRFGGTNGIKVNLALGQIVDGWGHIDTISGVEEIWDTIFDDSFTGSDLDDYFVAGAGVDSFNGGSGIDEVNLEGAGEQLNGASVDLALATGQIIDDGWGNTESVVSIERIDGSDWDDMIFGSNSFNVLHGDGGNDTINGRGGNDQIAGNAGGDNLTGGLGRDEFQYNRRAGQDPWGDTITDFKSGTDRITFEVGDFAGMDGTLRFVNGSAAGGTGSWFFFNSANKGLFWDADGTGAGEAVLVATLNGVNALATSDIELFV